LPLVPASESADGPPVLSNMKPSLVVDVGNSRIKWGRCADGSASIAPIASLPPDDPESWQRQFAEWGLSRSETWVVSGVHPARRDRLIEWLRERSGAVHMIDDPAQLLLEVALASPRAVGIDRLLAAVAGNCRRRPGVPAVIIDAGSAVTVDWLDGNGTFRGGAIFPGFRLMAQSLHDYTALLPQVEISRADPPLPGTSTPAAMEAGIFWSVAGGINAIVAQLAGLSDAKPDLWITGGDGALLRPAVDGQPHLWPEMTLEGLRLTAEALP
jgi:type III pantothenate kinase